MTHTTNLNLNKPDRADNVNVITDINANMDIIDGAFGTMNDNLGDAYDPTATYNVNDICIYNNVLYKCNTDITVPEAWNSAHWDATTVAEAMKNAVGDVSVDYPFTIAVADWSNTSPYTYTWTNAAIVDKVGVEVDFVSGAENGDIPYIYYEKVTGGVQFTSPIQPTSDVPVVVHVINAEAEAIASITGDMVATSVITGAANVDEALDDLDTRVTTLNSNLATYSRIYYKDFDLSSVTLNTGASAKVAVDITQTGKSIIGAIAISQTAGTTGAYPYFAVAPAPWGLFVFNTYSQQLTSALKVRVFYVDVVSAI